jgi:hypothetical protein
MEALRYESEGDSISAALLDSRDQGTQTVSYAHVENFIIGEESAKDRLDQLLSFTFQSGEQSIESKLWVLRGASMESLFEGEMDLAKRLTTLKTSGEDGTSLPLRSLRQVAAKLSDDGSALIPALRWVDEELVFDSYAVYGGGELLGYLEGEEARSLALLSDESMHWTEQIPLSDGREATVQLHSSGSTVRPRFEDGAITGLSISCDVEGKLMEVWSVGTDLELHKVVEEKVKGQLVQAVGTLKQLGVDGADLRRQAGLRAPWRWDLIKDQWQERYKTLPVEVSVKAELTEHF